MSLFRAVTLPAKVAEHDLPALWDKATDAVERFVSQSRAFQDAAVALVGARGVSQD